MHVTSMIIAMTTNSRTPIKLSTMMAMLLSSVVVVSVVVVSVVVVSVVVVSVVVPSGEKQDYNVSFFVDHSHSHIEHTRHLHWYPTTMIFILYYGIYTLGS